MAPRAKISREMIAAAALEVIREKGHENLNARTIAERLACSTQPVLYHFRSMEEIREAAYALADDFHTAYILKSSGRGDPMLEIGMRYIRFGAEEKNLFRFLFETGHFSGMGLEEMTADPQIQEVLTILRKGMGCTPAKAKRIFLTFFLLVHGIASLLANSGMDFEEEKFRRLLREEYERMTSERKGKR